MLLKQSITFILTKTHEPFENIKEQVPDCMEKTHYNLLWETRVKSNADRADLEASLRQKYKDFVKKQGGSVMCVHTMFQLRSSTFLILDLIG